MVREEIVAGIRNALDRGQSMEEAIQSFTIAGYPENDVHEAASAFQMSNTQTVAFTNAANNAAVVLTEKQRIHKVVKDVNKSEQTGISTGKFLLIILIILVIAAVVSAAIYMYVQKKGPAELFSGLIDKIKGIFKKN